MFLDTTLRVLKAKIEAAHTTNAPEWTVGYADITSSSFIWGETVGVFNGTTLVTILGAPAGGAQRQVKTMNFYNKDSVSHNITVQYIDDVTTYTLGVFTVAAGKTLAWSYENGWTVT